MGIIPDSRFLPIPVFWPVTKLMKLLLPVPVTPITAMMMGSLPFGSEDSAIFQPLFVLQVVGLKARKDSEGLLQIQQIKVDVRDHEQWGGFDWLLYWGIIFKNDFNHYSPLKRGWLEAPFGAPLDSSQGWTLVTSQDTINPHVVRSMGNHICIWNSCWTHRSVRTSNEVILCLALYRTFIVIQGTAALVSVSMQTRTN